MDEPSSVTLVLGHTFSDRTELVGDLIAQPVDMRVVRWAETEVPVTFDDDRSITEVAVTCESCGQRVVAHLLHPRLYRRRRLAWLALGLAIIAAQALAVALFVVHAVGGGLHPATGVVFTAALLTLPVGFLVASLGAGQVTDVPRGRRPGDGVHGFRVDPP